MARDLLFTRLKLNIISIYFKQLISEFVKYLRTVLSPFSFFQKEKNQAYGLLFLAVALISIKGFAGEQNFFSSVVRDYIEETAASVSEIIEPQLADISGLAASGQGGPEETVDPVMVQENSVVAYEPASTDYIIYFKPHKITEYTVQPGDAISFIASDFGVSVNTILWANNLRDADAISSEQILKIPPVSGVIHTVKSGDTIEILAKKYSADIEKIVVYNDLDEDESIQIGQELIIPDAVQTSVAAKSSSPAKKFSYLPDLGGYFIAPATGYNWNIIHGRNGIDIANSCGTPVYAAADGNTAVALPSGYNGGFGKYIKLVHPNGTETLYSHLSKLMVAAGEYVQRGQLIALIGTTGRSTGCHLHFEVHGARNPLAKY